jgi:hypothetical protein
LDFRFRIRATDAEIDAAVSAARNRGKAAIRILEASFNLERDAITIVLSNGSEISVPRRAIRGLDKRSPSDLMDLEAQSSGFSVRSKRGDTGIRLECILEAVAGPSIVSIAAAIAASHKSPAKAAAARVNGRKGGRPGKAPTGTD